MLRAIQLMGWPLDMICSVDIWFDDDTPAELPPMVAFKDEYDAKVLETFGIPVTRLCATKKESSGGARVSYCSLFYKNVYSAKYGEHIKGFPATVGSWCKLLKDQSDGRYTFEADLHRHLLSRGQTAWGGQTHINGYPIIKGNWCTSKLKQTVLRLPNISRAWELVYRAQDKYTDSHTRLVDGVTGSNRITTAHF